MLLPIALEQRDGYHKSKPIKDPLRVPLNPIREESYLWLDMSCGSTLIKFRLNFLYVEEKRNKYLIEIKILYKQRKPSSIKAILNYFLICIKTTQVCICILVTIIK